MLLLSVPGDQVVPAPPEAKDQRTRQRRAGAAAAAVVLFACGRGPNLETLTLTGSSTVAPVAAEIAKRFEAKHDGWRIDVQAGGSTRGIRDVREGLSDLGMVSRALDASEADLVAFEIALDGICLIVNASNPVETLGDDEVIGIFTGRIRNWAEAGGRQAPIMVVNKAEGRSTLELFLDYYGMTSGELFSSTIIGDNEQGIKTVAGNPHAIGYVSIGAAAHNAARGTPIKLLPVGGMEPTLANVQSGRFPLVRPLNLVASPPLSARQRTFVDFARSREVHDLVEGLSFAPASP